MGIEPGLPQDIADMGGRATAAKLHRIRSLLPPLPRAQALCEHWLHHGALFFRPIKRDELLGPFLYSVYGPTSAVQVGGPSW